MIEGNWLERQVAHQVRESDPAIDPRRELLLVRVTMPIVTMLACMPLAIVALVMSFVGHPVALRIFAMVCAALVLRGLAHFISEGRAFVHGVEPYSRWRQM